jgi:hypothetical protein
MLLPVYPPVKEKPAHFQGWLLAERAGFEPALPCGKRAFLARALGQTTLPLREQLFFHKQRTVLYHNLLTGKENRHCFK